MDEHTVELSTFTSGHEAYVYAPLPAVTSYGHRAELWLGKEFKEVKIKVVTAGDNCFIRMLDKGNGELFAECPLPCDGTPLTTAVEPVVDSSRYFVVKVVDRESRNHAFLGMGFRERGDASDFSAALDEYRQYLRRKQQAEHMRQEFDKLEAAGQQGDSEAGGQGSGTAAHDFSLKPGQTIRINLSSSLKRADSSSKSPGGGGSSSSSSSVSQQLLPQIKLAPPSGGSSSSFFKLQPPPAAVPAATAAAAASLGSPDGSSSQPMRPASNPGTPSADGSRAAAGAAGGSGAGAAAAADDAGAAGSVPAEDDWGDFVS